jgi:hypothetical protein
MIDSRKTQITAKVFTAIGEASMCWGNVDKAGVFQSDLASKIGKDLVEFILNEIETGA